MELRAGIHPSTDTLQAFALGKLDNGSATSLANHLANCPACQQAAAAMSSDDFLKRLNDAHDRSGTPAPAKQLSGLSQSVPAARPPASTPQVPPELINHPQYEVRPRTGPRRHGRRLPGPEQAHGPPGSAQGRQQGPARPTRRRWSASCARSARPPSSTTPTSSRPTAPCSSGDLLASPWSTSRARTSARWSRRRARCRWPTPATTSGRRRWACSTPSRSGMVHRDIKPHNLILARQGNKHIVKVLDFGLAKATQRGGNDDGEPDRRRARCSARRTTSPRSRRWTPPRPTSAPTSTAWAARSTTC